MCEAKITFQYSRVIFSQPAETTAIVAIVRGLFIIFAHSGEEEFHQTIKNEKRGCGVKLFLFVK